MICSPLPAWLDDDTMAALTAEFVTISQGALEWFGTPLAVDNKAADNRAAENRAAENRAAENRAVASDAVRRFDPVTIADRTIEQRFRAAIEARFPEHSIVGEEAARRDGSVDVEWIIDPIDGTRAFVTGRPMWGSLIGVSVAGQPVAGWMYQPVLGVTHVGHAGGTTMTDRNGVTVEVHTRPVEHLSDAVLMCTHPGMFSTREERWGFGAVERAVQQSRYDGDCANYGFVASGFGDLVIEKGLQPYDIVPLIPIIEGAGGVVTDVDGGSPLGGGWIVASANQMLHDAALTTLADGRASASA